MMKRFVKTFLFLAECAALMPLFLGQRVQAKEPFKLKLNGETEVGGRIFLDGKPSVYERGKFEEYRELPRQFFLEKFRLGLENQEETYRLEIQVTQPGEKDQNFSLKSMRVGRYTFEFDWDQIPHLYSTSAKMLGTQTSRGVFTLASPRPSGADHNAAPMINVESRWDTAHFLLSYSPNEEWDIKGEYRWINKTGDRPVGMAFGTPGNNFREILEPLEQDIHDMNFSTGLVRKNLQLRFNYNLSLFENDVNALISDNPSAAANGAFANNTSVPSRGQSSLAPDNQAHTWTFSGGLNLPLQTRVNANLSYSWRIQNDPFLPHTINPNISHTNLSLPLSTLDGEAKTLLLNLSLTSRPSDRLTLTGKYRYYNFDDDSSTVLFPAHVVDDKSFVNESRTALRFPYSKHNSSIDARWQIIKPLAFTVEMGWERWDRSLEHREADDTNELMPKAAIDFTPTHWLLLRTAYMPSWRYVSSYNTFAHLQHTLAEEDINLSQSQHPNLRKFDEASRDRHRVDILAQLTPLDILTTTFTYSLRDDDYESSIYGLQDDETWVASADIIFKPIERLALFSSYSREELFSKLASKFRQPGQTENATYDWISNTEDIIDTIRVGIEVALIPKKLDFSANWDYSHAWSKMTAFNPTTPAGGTAAQNATATAVNFPTLKDTLNRFETFLRFYLTKKLTTKVTYIFEDFSKEDFRTDNLLPATGSDIFLGSNYQNYATHMAVATLGYRF